jgi:membrane fusion protein (multidrug efflux system)
MKRFAVGFATLVLTGLSLPAFGPGHAAEPAGAPPAVLVQVAALRALSVPGEYIGRVQALEKVDLRARVEGFLGPRQFQDGDKVAVNRVLFTIEQEPFEAVVEQKKAQLEGAEATLANARVQLQRAQTLIRTQTVAQTTLDDRTAEEARARAAFDEAKAALRDAEIRLSYTEIRTPIAGTVGRALVSPGNLVGPGTGVLATVVQADQVRVLFPVTQRELLEARRQGGVSQPLLVRARLADGTLYGEEGRIDFLDIQVDPRTDGQIVRAVFPNPAALLAEGQTVRIVIEEKEAGKVVVIPEPSVAIDQTGPYVFVVSDGDKVEQRRVRLGAAREGMIAVEEGIKAGERVVVQGQQRVSAGMVVAPQLAPSLTPAPASAVPARNG